MLACPIALKLAGKSDRLPQSQSSEFSPGEFGSVSGGGLSFAALLPRPLLLFEQFLQKHSGRLVTPITLVTLITLII